MASISCNNCSPPGTGVYAHSEITFVDMNRLQAHSSLVHVLISFDRSRCVVLFCSIVCRQVTSNTFFNGEHVERTT